MSKLQWFPRYRTTLPEMKWEQQQRVDEINRLYELLAPRVGKTQRQSILASDKSSTESASGFSPFTISSGGSDTVNIEINDSIVAGIRSKEGITSFGEMGTANEQFDSRILSLGWTGDTHTINWVPSYETASGWINVYAFPKMDQYQLDTENALYLDGVGTDVTLNKVVSKAGDIISPYIGSAPADGSLDFNFKFYWSSEEPIGAKQIADEWTFPSELLNTSGTDKETVKYNEVLIWIGAIKYDNGAYGESVYNLINYQPHLGSEMMAYDSSEAGETGGYQTSADTMQQALDIIGNRFAGLLSQYLAMESQLSAMPDVVHITKSTGDLTSYGYSENTAFPSAIGKRWDK